MVKASLSGEDVIDNRSEVRGQLTAGSHFNQALRSKHQALCGTERRGDTETRRRGER